MSLPLADRRYSLLLTIALLMGFILAVGVAAMTDPLRIGYEQVAERWRQVMRPALNPEAIASGGRRSDGAAKAPATNGQPSPEAILGELREGINSAYRQLRELLTTFRLKIDGQGLRAALAQTIDEFRDRGDLIITLEDQLPPGLLSPNEEVHVLQIVREALSNATRHARARHLKVRLDMDADSERVQVEICDDGCGLRSTALQRGHYGLSIMRERACSLGGELSLDSEAGKGARVLLRFRSRSRAQV